MSFLDTMREILETEGLLKHDTQKTRPLSSTEAWLAAWRELAAITDGLTVHDPRFRPIMVALEQCDTAYLAGDWPGFQQAAQQVRQAVEWGRAGQ